MDSDEPENPSGNSAILGGEPPPATSKDASRKERDIRDDLNAFEKQSVVLQRRLFWATIAIWVTTGIYVFVTYRQWRTMQDQLGVMNNQLADARKTAIESSNVTNRQLDIAGKQANSQKVLADANKDIAAATTKSSKATEQLARATADAAAASHSLADSAGQSTAATQRLAAAANDANTVSRELVRATQQSNEMTINFQRAFVLVKGATVEYVSMDDLIRRLDLFGLRDDDPKNDPKKDELLKHIEPVWLINLIWENSGNTSTKDLTISTTFWCDVKNTAKQPLDISAIPKDRYLAALADTKLLLGPKQSAPVMSGAASAIGLAGLAIFGGLLGQPHFYVFGTAKYRDILNPAYIHRTDFCYRVELTGDFKQGLIETKSQTKVEPPAAKLTPCENHNCTDEGCEPYPVTPPEPANPPAKPPT